MTFIGKPVSTFPGHALQERRKGKPGKRSLQGESDAIADIKVSETWVAGERKFSA
jgi:hypothetical protein